MGTTSSLLLTRLLVHDPEVKVDGPLDMASSAAAINASAKDGKIYKNTIKSRTPSNKEKARP